MAFIAMGPSYVEYIRVIKRMPERHVKQQDCMPATTQSSSAMTNITVRPPARGNVDKGGLGGEFVISTSSKTSGVIVIRHELGHNLIPVGEEYDGGYVYSGVNAAHSLPPPWTHWFTNLSTASTEQRNRVIFQEYPWLGLESGAWRKMFYTNGHDGGWERVFIQASVSGCPEREDLWVGIDGRELDWFPTGNDDRRFLEWHSEEGFAPGFHVIEVRQLTEAKKGRMPRQLCSIEIIEYGPEEEYHLEKVFKFGNTRLILRAGLGIFRRTIFMGGKPGDPLMKGV